MTRSIKFTISACLLLVGIAVVAMLHDLFSLPGPVRVALVLVFLALGPGHGWIWSLGLKNVVIDVALIAGLGLSLALAVSLTMAALGTWSPVAGMYCLLGIGLAGSLLWLATTGRRERSEAR